MRRMNLELDEDVAEGLARAQALIADGQPNDARAVYAQLLDAASGRPVQGAAIAHMYAIAVDDPHEKLAINLESLRLAESAPSDEFPYALRATLFANIGWSHRALGDAAAAADWYRQAQTAADGLAQDDYGRMMRHGIASALAKL
jgi:hypothetical protein